MINLSCGHQKIRPFIKGKDLILVSTWLKKGQSWEIYICNKIEFLIIKPWSSFWLEFPIPHQIFFLGEWGKWRITFSILWGLEKWGICFFHSPGNEGGKLAYSLGTLLLMQPVRSSWLLSDIFLGERQQASD